MGRLVQMIKRRSATPTADDFAEFRRAIDHGTGPAEGFSAPDRVDALRGLESMLTRCPQVLVLVRDRGDVPSLIAHARSRRS